MPLRPADYRPQKALLVDEPPSGDAWVHELKLDGFRMGVFIARRQVHMVSRRGTEYTSEYPEICEAAKRLPVKNAVLDGEVVVLDARGIPSFQALQQLATSRRGLTYFAFDVLSLDGEDLTNLPLEERKARLRRIVGRGAGVIRYSAHFDGDGADVFAKACALGAEGIVSKRRDGRYLIGTRSAEWQKIKCVKRQEFVVGGFTDPEGSRVGIGSMLIGYYDDGALRFAGKVGNGRGWTADFSRKLRRDLERIEITKSPFDPSPPGWLGRNAHWVRPKLVGEVEFTEWTAGGHVRHPTLLGFRRDKQPAEVMREREAHARAQAKPVFPRLGITTEDLVALYDDIAKWVLPHVRNRPLTLVRMRAPITRDDALRTQAEFVHHTARDQRFVSDVVPRIRIPEKKKVGEYCYIDSKDALLALIAAGVIELHTWNACIDDVEHPDRMVFDIDPGSDVSWARVVAAANDVRNELRRRGLRSSVKTTGGKGVHVIAPFTPGAPWDDVFELSRTVASALVGQRPELYTVAFAKEKRQGRILIDYKRNYRTSIAVAAFSMRARPDGTMSVPVTWSELSRLGGSDTFTIENVRRRLRKTR